MKGDDCARLGLPDPWERVGEMTGTYDWNPMPHSVAVRCPSCSGEAVFEFAEAVRIKRKADVAFFAESDLFAYEMGKDSCGHGMHLALFYAGLHGGVASITNLPEGYKPEDWSHSRYLYRSHGRDMGSVVCPGCHARHRHVLTWPADAYYSVLYRENQLWAFNKESAQELRAFIASDDRDVEAYRWRNFLLHIPSAFKTAKARGPVLKLLDRLLSGR